MSGQANEVFLPKAPLVTSNEQIFPSLHPFGPRYSRSLNQKRSSDPLENTLELCKKIHVTNASEGNPVLVRGDSLKSDNGGETTTKATKASKISKNKEKENIRRKDKQEVSLNKEKDLVNNSFSLDAFSVLQSLPWLLTMERLQMEMIRQSYCFNNEYPNVLFDQLMMVKAEDVGIASDSSLNEFYIKEEIQSSQQSDFQNLKVEYQSLQNIKIEEKSTSHFEVKEEYEESEEKSSKKNSEILQEEDEQVNYLMKKLQEELEIEIKDKQKIITLLKTSNNSVEEVMKKVIRNKSRYRFALKSNVFKIVQ